MRLSGGRLRSAFPGRLPPPPGVQSWCGSHPLEAASADRPNSPQSTAALQNVQLVKSSGWAEMLCIADRTCWYDQALIQGKAIKSAIYDGLL